MLPAGTGRSASYIHEKSYRDVLYSPPTVFVVRKIQLVARYRSFRVSLARLKLYLPQVCIHRPRKPHCIRVQDRVQVHPLSLSWHAIHQYSTKQISFVYL